MQDLYNVVAVKISPCVGARLSRAHYSLRDFGLEKDIKVVEGFQWERGRRREGAEGVDLPHFCTCVHTTLKNKGFRQKEIVAE